MNYVEALVQYLREQDFNASMNSTEGVVFLGNPQLDFGKVGRVRVKVELNEDRPGILDFRAFTYDTVYGTSPTLNASPKARRVRGKDLEHLSKQFDFHDPACFDRVVEELDEIISELDFGTINV